MEETKELFFDGVSRLDKNQKNAVKQAKEFSQSKLSEKDFLHARKTAEALERLGMNGETIEAAYLFPLLDETKNTQTTPENLKEKFDKHVIELALNVDHLSKFRYHGVDRHKESLRKLLLAISSDIRVLIIKLVERIYRFETLHNDSQQKQERTALETLEIYAPIANRLGMGNLKGELEDRAFSFVYPKKYKETKILLKQKSKESEEHTQKMYRSLQKNLYKKGIRPIGSDHRQKRLYSLYQKLKRYDMDIDKIYDIAALRIIVPSINDCYRSLGIIHSIWNPRQGRIKDYIATPKANGYQSLHTTIETGDGGIVEIQIRTEKMHREAEFGIAAHFAFKETPKNPQTFLGKKFEWIRELARWKLKLSEKGASEENFHVDFFKDRVFVFTPQKDVIDLPQGSGPIDFAYAIHSKIGDYMSGAKINGKLSSLESILENGDTVEILTKKERAPTSKWLDYTKTPLAKKHIKQAVQERNS